MSVDIDRVPWATLQHNYGSAADVPALLHGCAEPDASRAADALDRLDNLPYHQGGWVCSAAGAALPFLLALAHDPAVRPRDGVVELIGRIAREATIVLPRFVDPGWPAALAAAVPRMLGLLDDADPRVRREAALLVSTGGLPAAQVAGELWRRWREESDRVTRWERRGRARLMVVGDRRRRGDVGAGPPG